MKHLLLIIASGMLLAACASTKCPDKRCPDKLDCTTKIAQLQMAYDVLERENKRVNAESGDAETPQVLERLAIAMADAAAAKAELDSAKNECGVAV
jgi:hypothetical protein